MKLEKERGNDKTDIYFFRGYVLFFDTYILNIYKKYIIGDDTMPKKEISNETDVIEVGNGTVNLAESKKGEIDDSKIKITHIMADGTIRDSIDGYEIPYNEKTAIAYQLLLKWADEKQEKE